MYCECITRSSTLQGSLFNITMYENSVKMCKLSTSRNIFLSYILNVITINHELCRVPS